MNLHCVEKRFMVGQKQKATQTEFVIVFRVDTCHLQVDLNQSPIFQTSIIHMALIIETLNLKNDEPIIIFKRIRVSS